MNERLNTAECHRVKLVLKRKLWYSSECFFLKHDQNSAFDVKQNGQVFDAEYLQLFLTRCPYDTRVRLVRIPEEVHKANSVEEERYKDLRTAHVYATVNGKLPDQCQF